MRLETLTQNGVELHGEGTVQADLTDSAAEFPDRKGARPIATMRAHAGDESGYAGWSGFGNGNLCEDLAEPGRIAFAMGRATEFGVANLPNCSDFLAAI